MMNISPLDGRYAGETAELKMICSEFALVKLRVEIEVKWLKNILPKLSADAEKILDEIIDNFSLEDANKIKQFEKSVNHDVKAVEYFLKEKFSDNSELNAAKNFIHFAATSDDINNIAYGLMLKKIRSELLLPHIEAIYEKLMELAHEYAEQPMLARTHGQPATPTTLGKEFANFAMRVKRGYENLKHIAIQGKFNGTVGNFNVHGFVYPDIDWQTLCQKFVADFGLSYNEYTTQIEPHDSIAEIADSVSRINVILIGLVRDIWGYVSLGYLKQKVKLEEIGSSVMPHKVNPIDFENAEGNLGLANSLLNYFKDKLPISRWQRDLSDSTVLRNLGVGFGYAFLAYKMLLKGLNKIQADENKLNVDLEQHWEILAEAVQTMMRRHDIHEPYEKLKELSRGKKVTKEILHDFIRKSELPQSAKDELFKLTPLNYLGLAVELAKNC